MMWIGLGLNQVGRAGYEAQCSAPGSLCDPANAPNVLSYKGSPRGVYTDQGAITALQNEICSGNPVITVFNESGGGHHFMLVTGIAVDPITHVQTFQVNNPGTKDGEGQFSDALKEKYTSVYGYVLYHPSKDPAMMLIASPTNVHFVVTDPLGRRTGYDPTTSTNYAEIPGADYGDQSINTPEEAGFTPETFVDENYFTSANNVVDGEYQVQVFGVTGGSYYLDYRSYDSNGNFNDSNYLTGAIQAGASLTQTLTHSSQVVPLPTASMRLTDYSIVGHRRSSFTKSHVKIAGLITPNSGNKVVLSSNLVLTIGGVTGYSLTLPASAFKAKTFEEHKIKRTNYFYHHEDTDIFLSDSGRFEIKLREVNLSALKSYQMGYVGVAADSTSADARVTMICKENGCHLQHSSDHGYDHDESRDHGGH